MSDKIPLLCPICNEETMVDLGNLDKRPFDQVITLLGFTCEHCGEWETVSVETAALLSLIHRIERTPKRSKKYAYLMGKAIHKANNLMKKVRNQHGQSHNGN